MPQRIPAIYIMANQRNGTLYTGVTSNLKKRVFEHKYGIAHSFSKRYNCTLLVYYEQYDSIIDAIEREKQIKGGSRKKKLELIESLNPMWLDLSSALF